jgi:hypothetical protein
VAGWNGTIVVLCRDWEGLQTMADDEFEVWGEFFLTDVAGQLRIIQKKAIFQGASPHA